MGKIARIIAFAFLLLIPVTAPASQYRIHNIGSLIGTQRNTANAINDSGVVVAGSLAYEQDDHQSAYVWKSGVGLSYIQTPGRFDTVSDINAAGEVVGSGGAYPHTAALRQANENIVDLGRLPGTEDLYSYASSINNAGQIAGVIGNHAVFWAAPDSPVDISGDNGRDNTALDVNNRGQVLWSSTWMAALDIAIQPYIWTQSGGSTPLALPGGASYAIASAINDQGIAVGRLGTGDVVKWLADGSVETLPDLGSIYGNSADGINNNGQVVGSLGFNAVLWDSHGSVIDLGAMLGDRSWPGEYQSCATDINDNGWVTGCIYSPDWSYCQAVVWEPVPVPEPSSLLALASLMTGFAAVVRRRRSD